jgi:hypothetical protein
VKVKFGDIVVESERGRMLVRVPEDHPLLSEIKSVGVRWNPNDSALVVGSTYPNRQIEIERILNHYQISTQGKVYPGTYGKIQVSRPFPKEGFVIVFKEYDADLKDSMKKMVSGCVYQGLSKTWHVPADKESDLAKFLIGAMD